MPRAPPYAAHAESSDPAVALALALLVTLFLAVLLSLLLSPSANPAMQPPQAPHAAPPAPAPNDPDAASLALIAAHLSAELQLAQDRQAAERVQLALALEASVGKGKGKAVADPGHVGDNQQQQQEEEEQDSAEVVALRLQLDAVHTSLSRSYIPLLATADRAFQADHARAVQEQREADEAARREGVDAAFAREVGRAEREGEGAEEAVRRGAEGVLGKAMVEEIKAAATTSNAAETARPAVQVEEKGKTRAPSPVPVASTTSSLSLPPPPPPPKYTPFTCSICLESTKPVADPYKAASAASSSTDARVGCFVGPREDGHVACLDCMRRYLEEKLENGARKAFPVVCPGGECTYEVTDADASRVFGETNLERWYYRKLLDSSRLVVCPNPVCNERLELQCDEVGEGDDRRAACPSCHKMLCTSCVSIWHDGYTCEQFQTLPLADRDPADLSLLTLARQKRWSRCPGCKVMVELVHGCMHMTCSLCGTEHCYLCGSLRKKTSQNRYGRCGRGCPLWVDEATLLGPEYRDAGRVRGRA